MGHIENKNRLLTRSARYFLGVLAAVLIGGVIFAIAYQAGQQAPRGQTQLVIDPAVEEPFLSLFKAVHRPNQREVFPAFSYVDARGREQTFSVKRGEYVLLNVWATWCPPCLIELPDLQKLQESLPDDAVVKVMAVSVDQSHDQAELAEFLRVRGLWQKAAKHDVNGVIMRNAPVRGLPSSFLLAEGGEILYIFEGAALWADPASLAFFNSLASHR